MINPYNENYFNSGNYIGYLERSERYKKLAQEIIELLRSIKFVNGDETILDYGCATGFLLDGLHDLGISKTSGYDISEWALSKVDREKHRIITLEEKQCFDIGFFLDVLEHMSDEDIIDVLSRVSVGKMIVRIPCSVDGKTFLLPQSKRDKTHINCRTKDGWIEFLDSLGYELVFCVNLKQIYDSDGVFCACFRSKS